MTLYCLDNGIPSINYTRVYIINFHTCIRIYTCIIDRSGSLIINQVFHIGEDLGRSVCFVNIFFTYVTFYPKNLQNKHEEEKLEEFIRMSNEFGKRIACGGSSCGLFSPTVYSQNEHLLLNDDFWGIVQSLTINFILSKSVTKQL